MNKAILYALIHTDPVWNERFTDYAGRWDTMVQVFGDWSIIKLLTYGL